MMYLDGIDNPLWNGYHDDCLFSLYMGLCEFEDMMSKDEISLESFNREKGLLESGIMEAEEEEKEISRFVLKYLLDLIL